MNVVEFLDSSELTGDAFAGPSWDAWRAILRGAYGLPLGRHASAFERLAGARTAPRKRVSELWAVAGRRSGKTQIAAALAVYEATIGAELSGALARLAPGEVGVVALLAVDRRQAEVALGYVRALVNGSPALRAMIRRETQDGVDLSNSTRIEVATSDYRRIRGRTLLAAVFDEVAFWRSDDSANPDREIHRAAVPALVTTGGPLVGISSPYARRGLLYDRWRTHYGQAGDVLVVQGGSRDFNPTIPARVVDAALGDDPDGARAEWLAEFRRDIEAFLTVEVVDGCTRSGPLELPPVDGVAYHGFVDPSGGGGDEFSLAIGHREHERVIIDLVHGRKGVPATIVEEYAATLKRYNVTRVQSDRYAGSWPADEFRRHGIEVTAAERPKSDLYRDLLPQLNSGRVELPPDPRLAAQLIGLERRTARGGKDSIDHPPGGHDDRANAVAGVASMSSRAVEGPNIRVI